MPRSTLQWIQFGKLAAAFIIVGLILAALVASASQSASSRKPHVITQRRPEGLPDPMANPKAGDAAIMRLAKKSHGDYDRLTPVEKDFVDGVTAGHGPEVILMRFQGQGPAMAAPKKR